MYIFFVSCHIKFTFSFLKCIFFYIFYLCQKTSQKNDLLHVLFHVQQIIFMDSISRDGSISPRFRCSRQNSFFISPNDLSSAKTGPVCFYDDLVASCFQLFYNLRICLSLDFHFFPLDPLPPGGIQSSLRIHMEIDGIQDHLQMSLGLHESAHHTKRSYGFSSLGQKSWNDRVIRFLSRSQTIIHRGIQAEIIPSVIQGDTSPRNDNA